MNKRAVMEKGERKTDSEDGMESVADSPRPAGCRFSSEPL